MRANIFVNRQWSLLVGISLMAVLLLSFTIPSFAGWGSGDSWERTISNNNIYLPIRVTGYATSGGVWLNGQQGTITIPPNGKAKIKYTTSSCKSKGEVHIESQLGRCEINYEASCGSSVRSWIRLISKRQISCDPSGGDITFK